MFHVYYSRRRAWDGRCCVAFFLLLVFGADAHIREDEFFHRDCSHWICKRVASLFFFFLATTFFLFVCLRSWWAFYLFFFFYWVLFRYFSCSLFSHRWCKYAFFSHVRATQRRGLVLSLSLCFLFLRQYFETPVKWLWNSLFLFSVFFCVFFCSLSLLRNRRQ